MITTKGRYAIRIMLDIAEHGTGDFIPMKDIAARQEISLKYTDSIMPGLRKAGLVETSHGRGGGYRLLKEPSQINIWEILCATEGDMAPVSCLSADAKPCERATQCRTVGIWTEYYTLTQEFFIKKTLESLMQTPSPDNYVI